MAKPRHLVHAPIMEALVDIQVEQQQGLSFGGLQEALSKLDFGYYFKSQISQGTFGFRLTSDGQEPRTTTTAEAAQIGLRLHSFDEKYVAQPGRVHSMHHSHWLEGTLQRWAKQKRKFRLTAVFQNFTICGSHTWRLSRTTRIGRQLCDFLAPWAWGK